MCYYKNSFQFDFILVCAAICITIFFYFSGLLSFEMSIPYKKMKPDKKSSLIEAIRENKLADVEFLIENGANVNPETKHWTHIPLQMAIFEGHKQIVETLISKGAETNIQDYDGYFPIHRAVINNQVEIVEMLLKNGADIESRCSYSFRTPIFYAVRKANKKPNIDIVKTLLRYGAKIDQPNRYGTTPIHEVIFDNQKLVMEIFLKTSPNLKKPRFVSILHSAIYFNMLDIAEMLIDYGIEIDAFSPNVGATPIQVALCLCENNSFEATKMLLKKGVSLKIKSVDGNTPLECALKRNNGKELDLMKIITYYQHNSNV